MLAEARRAYTFLTLFGYRVDTAIVNRVFPDGGADAWRRAGSPRRRVTSTMPPTRSPGSSCARRSTGRRAGGARRAARPRASVYDDAGPDRARRVRAPDVRQHHVEPGSCCRFPCPWPPRTTSRLARKGDELIVSVASYRRLVTLPTGWRDTAWPGRACATGSSRSGSPPHRRAAGGGLVTDAETPRGRLARRGGGQAPRCPVRLGARARRSRPVTDCPDSRRRPLRRRTSSTTTSPPAPRSARCAPCAARSRRAPGQPGGDGAPRPRRRPRWRRQPRPFLATPRTPRARQRTTSSTSTSTDDWPEDA